MGMVVEFCWMKPRFDSWSSDPGGRPLGAVKVLRSTTSEDKFCAPSLKEYYNFCTAGNITFFMCFDVLTLCSKNFVFLCLCWFLCTFSIIKIYWIRLLNILNISVFLYSEYKVWNWCLTQVEPVTALHLMMKSRWQSQGDIRNNSWLLDIIFLNIK